MADKPDNQPDEQPGPADPQGAASGKADRGTRKGRRAARAAKAQEAAAAKSSDAGSAPAAKTKASARAAKTTAVAPAAKTEASAPAAEAAADDADPTASVTPRADGREGESVAGKKNGRLVGLAAGLGILVLGTGGIVAGSVMQPPRAAAELPPVSAAVPAGEYTGVCPEPLKLLDSSAEEVDPEFSPVSNTAETRARAVVLSDLGGTVPGSALFELGSDSALREIAEFTGEAGSTGRSEAGETKVLAEVVPSQDISAATVLTVEPMGQQHPQAGATMTYTAEDGDLRGLAAANCMTPSNDFWLLGASTTVGSSAVLNLYNATETASTVDLELVGAEGPIQAAGSRGLLIAPGESKSIVLAGLAANQESLAVHVSSSGGPIVGTIQQSILRELTPGGVELLQPSAGASLSQVVTGIAVQDEKTAQEIRGQSGYGSASPALNVVVPGASDATVEVRVFGPKGQVALPGGGVFNVAAGTVSAIPLDSLPEGTYSAEVTSDVSVVASGRVSRGTGEGDPVDFGWAPSTDRLGSEHLAIVPGGVSSRFTFIAPEGNAKVSVTPISANGQLGTERVVDVPGGSTVSLNPKANGADPAALLIGATGDPVYASQVAFTGSSPNISVLAVPPGTQGRQSVPVFLGY
ncbi:DUF5719 family protein [Arthrobacter sp. VKM Ac-2550]|uniref:DUF5719 family protein n=1 Tax=Crystallibacter permensis TaxID=1938888 RepID=UPI002226964C|nr:DUF5719 family protein [Arthrobacter sp. VKM Ac-2550]MCW2132459.1 hypothetical protein [Arthrobacter sp. VKM Ac-2550]